MKAIQGCTLIDGTGRDPVSKTVILFEDGRIVNAGPESAVRVPRGAEIIDAGGCFVIPGLIDLHVHLGSPREYGRTGTMPETAYGMAEFPLAMYSIFAVESARRTLAAGFTTVRDCGSAQYINVALRDAVDRGIVPGPRIIACAKGVSMTGGHGDPFKNIAYDHIRNLDACCRPHAQIADGVPAVLEATRNAIRWRADFIKLWLSGGILEDTQEEDRIFLHEYSEEEAVAVVSEAKRAGRPTATHATSPPSIKTAIKVGVWSVEHGTCLDEECAELMAKTKTYFVPTLSYVRHMAASNDIDARLRMAAKKAAERHTESLRMAIAAGVTIATGTDSGAPAALHGENATELAYLVDVGLSPMQALVAATKTAAAVARAKDVGTLEQGKLADLVVLTKNPLDDIRVLQQKPLIRHVLKGGQIVAGSV